MKIADYSMMRFKKLYFCAMSRLLAIIVLFSVFFTSNIVFGQGFKENHSPFGRRKKEKSNQRIFSKRGGGGFLKLFGSRNRGNVDFFASNRIIGKKGFFASLFRPKYSGNASLRRTKSAKKDDKNLFGRRNTKNKISFRKKQERQGKRRERTRKRGNVLFAKRKR